MDYGICFLIMYRYVTICVPTKGAAIKRDVSAFFFFSVIIFYVHQLELRYITSINCDTTRDMRACVLPQCEIVGCLTSFIDSRTITTDRPRYWLLLRNALSLYNELNIYNDV